MIRPGPIDWRQICRALMQGEGRYRPWEIGKLTLPEIALALDEGKPRASNGAPNMDDDEIEAYGRWYFSLTPRQKLELAREGRL